MSSEHKESVTAQPHIDVPKHHRYIKLALCVLAALIIAIVVFGSYCAYKYRGYNVAQHNPSITEHKQFPYVADPDNQEQIISRLPINAFFVGRDGALYYYIFGDEEGKNEVNHGSIYRLAENPKEKDVPILRLEKTDIYTSDFDKISPGFALGHDIIVNNKFTIIDLDNRKTKEVSAGASIYVSGTYIDSNGTFYYLAEQMKDVEVVAGSLTLYVVPLNQKNKRTYALKNLHGVDTHILGLAQDRTSLYLANTGQAGEELLVLNTKTGALSKVRNIIGDRISGLNPSGTKLAVIGASVQYDENKLIENPYAEGPKTETVLPTGCLQPEYNDEYKNDGGVVVIEDIMTGKKKEIYRNLDYPNWECRTAVRRIESVYWINNTLLAVKTWRGIVLIDTETGKHQTVFLFDTDNQEVTSYDNFITAATNDMLVLGHFVSNVGTRFEVLNLETGKVTNLENANNRWVARPYYPTGTGSSTLPIPAPGPSVPTVTP